MKRWLKIVVLAMVVLSMVPVQSSKGQTPEQFYRGKTIAIFTGSAGGAADLVSRALAPFLEKETGATVIVKNLPGGSTLQTENLAYRAKPDGLTLLIVNPFEVAQSTWFNEAGAVFDVAKFNWIGRFCDEPAIFCVSSKSPYQSITDLQQAKGLKFGSASPQSWYCPAHMTIAWILNLDAKVMSGLSGTGPMVLSIQKGELDGIAITETLGEGYVTAGTFRPLFVFHGESKVYSKLPVLSNLVKPNKEQQVLLDFLGYISKGMSTAPGVPQDRVDFLRKILKKTFEDKDNLQAFMKKGGMANWYGFTPGEELQRQLSEPRIGQEIRRLIESLMEKYFLRY